MRTTTIVINFNAGGFLKDCIQSVLASHQPTRVIVADNASSDDSLLRLEHLLAENQIIDIRQNASNLGFAVAVNQAAKTVESEFLLILNPDCQLQPETLGRLEVALDANPGKALAGPMVMTPQNKPETATYRCFPDPWKSLMSFSGLWRLSGWLPMLRGVAVNPDHLPEKTTEAEAVSGACMLVRRKAFESLHGLDEVYGLHCEDLDLMYRLQQAGSGCIFVPGALAFHQQGVSSSSRRMWVHRQKHISMLRFFRKFQAQQYFFPVRWLVVLGIHLRCLLLWPVVWLKG